MFDDVSAIPATPPSLIVILNLSVPSVSLSRVSVLVNVCGLVQIQRLPVNDTSVKSDAVRLPSNPSCSVDQ